MESRRGISYRAVAARGPDTTCGAAMPAFRPDAGIPAPLGSIDDMIWGIDSARVAPMFDVLLGAHGMLGQQWFSSRVWVFDYPGRRFGYYETPPAPRAFGPHTIPATLRMPPRQSYPRIQIAIDGDSLDMLFDTGASISVTPEALRAIGDGGNAVRGGSFIMQSVADRWRAAHPEWRFVRGAETNGADLIEVPSLSVAGHTVGPVWFATRPDASYTSYMRQFMDAPIVGALGGNALRSFRITMDYPNQRITLER